MLALSNAVFPSATRIQYLARLPAGANDPENPVDPVEHIFSVCTRNGRTSSILSGKTSGMLMISS